MLNILSLLPSVNQTLHFVLESAINTELQFVFFDSVWATEARPTCRVNEIKHLRDNYMKCGLALVL